MKRIYYILIFLVLIFYPLLGLAESRVVWFDSNGAIRFENPLAYFNGVLKGIIKDPQTLSLIRNHLGSEITHLSKTELYELSDKLFDSQTKSAIYYDDSEKMKGCDHSIRQNIRSKIPVGKTSTLEIQGFGLKVNGPLQEVGGIDVNHILLFPALSSIVLQLSSLENMNASECENFIQKKLEENHLNNQVKKQMLNLLGKAQFTNLTPGPWLVWVNQYGFLTYLYRIWIKPGETAVLKLEKLLILKRIKVSEKQRNT